MRTVIYTRVSSDRSGSARSVEEQERECRAHADRQGWTVVDVLTENDRSASRFAKRDRPQYRQLVELLRAGRADVLLTWEASRAQRDLNAYVQLRDLCRDAGVLWSYSGRTYDLSDVDDEFTTGLDALLAERESGQTRKRVARSVRAQADRGMPHGKIPYGYRREYDPTSGRLLRQVPDENQAPIVAEMARRVLSGEALAAVAKDLDARGVVHPGGRKWAAEPGRVRDIVLNPAVAGLRVFRGEVIGQAAWDGIISQEQQAMLTAKLRDPDRRSWKDARTKHLLTAIAECGVCAAPVRLLKNRGTPSYCCSSKFCVARAEDLVDEVVTEVIVNRLARPDVRELLMASGEGEAGVIQAALDEVAGLRARLDGFYTQAAYGELSPQALASVERRILPQIEAAEARARAGSTSPVVADLAAEATGEGIVEIRHRWEGLSVPQRREVVRTLVRVVIHKTVQGRRRDAESIEIVWL